MAAYEAKFENSSGETERCLVFWVKSNGKQAYIKRDCKGSPPHFVYTNQLKGLRGRDLPYHEVPDYPHFRAPDPSLARTVRQQQIYINYIKWSFADDEEKKDAS